MSLSKTGADAPSQAAGTGPYGPGGLFEVPRAGFVCHLGVVVDDVPMVVPTVYGFDDASRTSTGPRPEPDPALPAGVAVPPHVAAMTEGAGPAPSPAG
jgi:hypothetical protein